MKKDDEDDCYRCKKVLRGERWIGCICCERWAHIKCAFLSGIKDDNIKKVDWVCIPCKMEFSHWKNVVQDLDDLKARVNNGLQEMKNDLSNVNNDVKLVKVHVCSIGVAVEEVLTETSVEGTSTSWTEVVNKKRRKKIN